MHYCINIHPCGILWEHKQNSHQNTLLVAGNIPVQNKNILLIGYITDSVSILLFKSEITHLNLPSVHTNPTYIKETKKSTYKFEAQTSNYREKNSRTWTIWLCDFLQ